MDNILEQKKSEIAIQARRKYFRDWYQRNKKRVQKTQERFFLKKAEEFGLIENFEEGNHV